MQLFGSCNRFTAARFGDARCVARNWRLFTPLNCRFPFTARGHPFSAVLKVNLHLSSEKQQYFHLRPIFGAKLQVAEN
jgi:hypothetical protein